MKKLLAVILFVLGHASAQTLTSLVITPPAATGFWAKTTASNYSLQLGVTCYYSNGTSDNCTAAGGVTWMVNTAGPSITSGGLVTGTSASDLQFDALAYNGAILDHRTIYVTASSPPTLTIRPESTGNAIGDSGNIPINTPVTIAVADTVTANQSYFAGYCAWSSSAPSVASIDPYGVITGHAAGDATMTCQLPGQSASRLFHFTTPTVAGTMWYVRPDGGTRYDAAVPTGQCDGKTDAAYPGSGTNQHCAFNEIMYLYTDESSSSVATYAMGPGDIATVYPKPGGYSLSRKNFSTLWVAPTAFALPSGSSTNPTTIRGSNYAACSTDANHTGNRTLLNFYGYVGMDLRGVQNVKFDCIDITAGQDCTNSLTGGPMDISCTNGGTPFAIFANSLTTVELHSTRIHGASTGWSGTTSPGVTVTGSSAFQYNFSTGFNSDDPFGFPGNRSSGASFNGTSISYNGFTEEQPKTLTDVNRDGAGHLNVTFAGSQLVNYTVGNNIVLTGNTPSDLDGTYPVTSVSFNQNTATITGGTCTGGFGAGPIVQCVFNTSAAVGFAAHSFVWISGASPSWLNGGFFVAAVSGSTFTVYASSLSRPGWATSSISSGGTAATAITLVATAAGSAETASVPGTAGHVYNAHIGYDQNTGGFANGDGIGTGADTFGNWSSVNGVLRSNTQDGWDMLHSSMISSIFTGNLSEGNMGAPSKFGNTNLGIYQSNVQIGNAGRMMAPDPNMAPDYNQYLSMFYRAANTLPIAEHFWSKMDISNNTWETGFPTIWDDVCADPIGCASPLASAYFIAQNNVFLGFLDSNAPSYSGQLPGVYFYNTGVDPPQVTWTFQNNMGFNVRNQPTGTGNQWTTDPLVAIKIPDILNFADEVNAQSFDMQLTSSSPARSAGLHNTYTPTTDITGNAFLNPPAMGAYEFGSTSTAAIPTFSPVAGTYGSAQSVTLSTTSSGAIICYNTTGAPATNGSTGCTTGTLYSGAITVSSSETLYAVAGGTGFTDSAVGSAAYVISSTVATPTASPVGGTFTSTTGPITLSDATSGATICYRTDGTNPAATTPGTCDAGSTTYSGTFAFTVTTTLKALGTKAGSTNSGIMTQVYTVNPPVGPSTSVQGVTMSGVILY